MFYSTLLFGDWAGSINWLNIRHLFTLLIVYLLSLSKNNFWFQPISSWNSYSHKDASSRSSSKKDFSYPIVSIHRIPSHIYTIQQVLRKGCYPIMPHYSQNPITYVHIYWRSLRKNHGMLHFKCADSESCSSSKWTKVSLQNGAVEENVQFWYFVTKIVVTYCEKKLS